MKTSQSSVDHRSSLIRNLLVGAIFLCCVMQFFMALRFEINQDEFYNLNRGYEFILGDVGNPFQTLMFRFSGWLKLVPGNEVDQIIGGRMFTYGAALLTCLFIYKISRRYFSTQAALFAVLVFFGFNYVFRHMTAFRTDILVTMCLMALLWVVSDPNQSWRKVIVAGVLIGMAFTLALKSIFYMPIVAIFLLGRWKGSNWSRQAFLFGFVMFAVAITTYAIIFVLHDPSSYSTDQRATYLQTISGSSFLSGGLFNRWGLLVISLFRSFLGWGLLFLGLAVSILALKNPEGRPKFETICLLSFIVPLTPVIFYYHANPYFYPFMLAPAMVFVAAASDRFLVTNKSPIFIILITIFAALPVGTFIRSMSQHQGTQRTVINAVHEIFPTSVPVVDYCGMISSFDRVNEVGLFINPDVFAHSKYLKAETSIMTDFIKTYQPQIFLANVSGLDLNEEFEHEHHYPLLEEDTKILKDNYVKFWGPIYVPGKEISADGLFKILMAGTYTYYGSAGTTIDGVELEDEQIIDLSEGLHAISGLNSTHANLVWGDHLKKPDIPEPARPLFNGS